MPGSPARGQARHEAPCNERSRFVAKAIAVQRGLDPTARHREQVRPARFGLEDGPVCGPPSPGQRTRCYSEHSPRRKNCPMLAKSGVPDVHHAPGLYVSGVGPYRDRAPARGEPGLLETLILGPHRVGPMDVAVTYKKMEHVFNGRDLEVVAKRFAYKTPHRVIPSVDEMRRAARAVVDVRAPTDALGNARRNLVACADELASRVDELVQLRRACVARPATARAAQRTMRNIFLFSMYARRWAGPGTPYPIKLHETNRRVGQHKPISPALVGQEAYVDKKGEVKLREGGSGNAGEVADGKASGMMAMLLFAITAAAESEGEAARRAIVQGFRAALPQQTTDGTCWPTHDSMWDVLFEGDSCVAQGFVNGACIRQMSGILVLSCDMVMPYVYKTRPQWMRWEGTIDEIE